jgi:tripartite-type tricarboxylate transporter receptor subunit TctC
MISRKLLLAIGLLFPSVFGWAQAQDYPVRPIKFIVSYPPGGPADILARTLAQKLGDGLGQQVLVDNRGGANGNIGAELAAKSPQTVTRSS